MSGQSAPTLTVTPLTWNIIGLDSNKPTAGPKFFPVGARVCSSVATTNVTVTLMWDSANANINIRGGSLNPIVIASIGAGSCSDAYFEVEVTQVAAAYDTARRYHITATDGSGTASTPTPRELYVEHLVSQSRNGITDVKLNGVSVPPGGEMNLTVGNTYTIELDGFTATQGYNQLESFINFPNTIFQILAVNTTYSADDNTTNVPNPNDRLYANACVWENDPTSPNYRSCVGGDFKAGGTVMVTYTVKIIGGGGSSQVISTLFYDFSGSSFHYNSDLSTSARIVNVLDPAALTLAKAFTPSTTVAGGLSTLTFTITNPTGATITGVNFMDVLPSSPGAMVVANPPGATTSGCGTPIFAPAAGASSISFSNGTIGENGTCTVSVKITVPVTGTYNNTSGHLFVDTLDTGHTASTSLTAGSVSGGTNLCGLTLAHWTVPNGTTANLPDIVGGIPTTKAADVSTATLSANLPGSAAIDATKGQGDTTSWNTWGYKNGGQHVQFAVDTTNYTGVVMSFYVANPTPANGPTSLVVSYDNGGGFTDILTISNPAAGFTLHTIDFTGLTSTTGTTTFRIRGSGANNDNSNSGVNYDEMKFTGCAPPQKPTLAKAFSPNPIAVNAPSTLTFTLTNPNSAQLTGVKFSDTLPAGLQVAATPAASTTCGNSPSWAPAAAATTLDFGQTTGAIIPASSSCTTSVNVTATTSGPHPNVSGFIFSTESGTNAGTGGSATASLTALQPPSIAKVFSPDPILTGGTSTLTFLVSNPNPNDSLPSVSFSDTLPTSPGAMTVAGTPNASTAGCGAPTFAPASGAASISFSGGTIAAGGLCTVKVDVTAPVAGDYANASGIVAATINGVPTFGNTSADSLTVRDANPGISLVKRVSTSSSGPWTPFLSIAPGASIFYLFTIENTGDVPLSPVSVTDPLVNSAGCSWPASLPVASLVQDPTATCVVGPVTALAGDHPNTATAHGTSGGNVSNSLPSSADYIGALPGFSLLKQIGTSATGPWSSSINVAPGTNVFYKFTVVNTGNVAVSGVNVTDPDVSTAACTFSDPLAVNSATTCVVGPVVGSLVLGPHTNTATAHGTNGGTPVDSSPSAATYTVATSSPDLTISKTHTGNFTQGQPGMYTISVSNVGLAPTAGTVTVTDTLPTGLVPTNATSPDLSCGIALQTVTCTTNTVLNPGASYAPITMAVNVLGTAASSVVNTATVGGGGDTNGANNSSSDPTTVIPGPDLTIVKSHSGNFVQGQTGASYTLTVTNFGPGPTSGLVTVTETAPTDLTVTAMSGTNWTCTTLPTCTRSDVLAASLSYEPITVVVNVSPTAAATVTNVATVSGGGDINGNNNSFSDPTTVSVPTAGPDLTILKSHSGTFVQGQTGATYTLTVRNVGGTATSGLVTVTETPPAGLTVTGLSGTGWNCTVATLTCTRSDALAPSASYPAITVTVNVAAAAPASVTNTATVSGGGESNTSNNSASDPTVVDPYIGLPNLAVTKAHIGHFTQGQTGATYTITVTNVGPVPTSGTVTVTDTLPAGLIATAIGGPGWNCVLATLTCTRADVLAAGASYAAIVLTVDVATNAAGSLVNSVAVSGGGDTSPANNAWADGAVVDPAAAAAIPTLGEWAFALLGAALVVTALWALHRRAPRSAAR